jgi:hypothetical protein
MRASTRQTKEDNEKSLELFHGIFLNNIPNKRKLLRNCVKPELGLYIFDMAFKESQEVLKI